MKVFSASRIHFFVALAMLWIPAFIPSLIPSWSDVPMFDLRGYPAAYALLGWVNLALAVNQMCRDDAKGN